MPSLKQRWEDFRDRSGASQIRDYKYIAILEAMFYAGMATAIDSLMELIDEGLTSDQALLWIRTELSGTLIKIEQAKTTKN